MRSPPCCRSNRCQSHRKFVPYSQRSLVDYSCPESCRKTSSTGTRGSRPGRKCSERICGKILSTGMLWRHCVGNYCIPPHRSNRKKTWCHWTVTYPDTCHILNVHRRRQCIPYSQKNPWKSYRTVDFDKCQIQKQRPQLIQIGRSGPVQWILNTKVFIHIKLIKFAFTTEQKLMPYISCPFSANSLETFNSNDAV